jgi:hypothetical protein
MMGRARCGRGEHNDGDRDHCISGRFLRMKAAREILFWFRSTACSFGWWLMAGADLF